MTDFAAYTVEFDAQEYNGLPYMFSPNAFPVAQHI